MSIRIVTTQQQLDAALAEKVDTVYIESEAGVWLRLRESDSAHVVARDSAHVVARDSAHVVAWGSAHVVAWGSAHVEAWDSAHVEAWDSAHVVAWDSAHVVARDSAHVVAWGSAHVVAWGSAHVEAWDSAHVVAWGSAHVEARGSAHVEARDSAHVVAWDSAHVVARDSAHVVAWGSAHVEAWDSAHVVARDSAHVVARPMVAIHLHSVSAHVEGGVVIDIASLDQSDPHIWTDMQGCEVTEDRAIVYKAVTRDLFSEWRTAYPIGQTVTAPDWRATDACGNGLHFGPTPRHARDYHREASRYLACSIPLHVAVGITGGGTAKIKARECVVLHEVDIDGLPLTPAEVSP